MNEEEIFHQALARSPEERPAFLEQACAGDPSLRPAVEALLRANLGATGFLEQPTPPPVATVDEPLRATAGAIIGPYKLLEQIGEGGVGAVWMAQQTEPVKRVVALKLIKAGMDTRQVIARFEAERQALALMDHANIARVLDAGATAAGRPYFVMDLVKGVPITKYCDEHRLTPRQRLELFIPVCQAVQHAHQKGIIHRDLKPSNVLVAHYDGKPVPKVIDFGVAKAAGQRLTDKTLVTGFGAIVGTLEYMSPEQAEVNQLDIDTRSDIYSLGVLLYELLTGSPPFARKELEKAGMLEMLRVIREQEPSKPSTKLSTADGLPSLAANRGTEPAKLTKLVRGELDWIVMKALEKDRNRRYETANGFAMDVQRYLADEPVQACPPSAGYRLRKFVRRNKTSLAVAGLVLFFIALLVSGSVWVMGNRNARKREAALENAARRAKLEEKVGLALEDVQAKYEIDNLPQAIAAVERAEGFMGSGTDLSDEIRQRAKAWRAELTVLEDLDELFMGLGDASQSPKERDAGCAWVFRGLGINVDELTVEEAGNRVRSRLTGKRLAEQLDRWAGNLLDVEPRPVSRRQRLIQIARAADPDALHTQVRLASENWDIKEAEHLAASADVERLSGGGLAELTTILFWAGGESGRKSALRLLVGAVAQRPDDYRLIRVCAKRHFQMQPPLYPEAAIYSSIALALRPQNHYVQYDLALCYARQGKLDEAIAGYRRAIRLKKDYAIAHSDLGRALRDQKKLGEAIASCRKAIELDPKLATAHNNLGIALHDQKKLGEAIACCRKAIELDAKYTAAHHMLGVVLMDQGKPDEAIVCYRKAVELDPKYALAHYNLGIVLKNQGKLDEAIACYRKAIELSPKHAAAHNNIGNALNDQGKLDEAIACYRKAIELDPKYATAHHNLGIALHNQKKLDEAIDAWRRAIELADPTNAAAYNNLARHLATAPDPKLRHPQQAVILAKKAVELAPKVGMWWNTLGVAHYRAGDNEAAFGALEKSMDLRQGGDANDWFFLAMSHWQLGHKKDARKWYDQAVQWMEKNQPKNEELLRFRAEAEKLLEIKK